MALSEEARARRYEWRAQMLRLDPGDQRKAKDAAVFDVAAHYSRAVSEARPAFEAAMDDLTVRQAEATIAWVKGGKAGDKPHVKDNTAADPAVLLFRDARDRFSDFIRTEDYRVAVQRCRMDDWAEPSDEELMG